MTLPSTPKSGDSPGLPLLFLGYVNAGSVDAAIFMAGSNLVTEDGEALAAMAVGGPAQSGNASISYPVIIGGKYTSAPSSVDEGDAVQIAVDSRGRLVVAPHVSEGGDIASTATVSETAASLVSANATRSVLRITNMDTADWIFLHTGSAPVDNSGIAIGPGDSYEFAGPSLTYKAVWAKAVSGSGGVIVAIYEKSAT